MLIWRILLKASASLLKCGGVAAINASGFERYYASYFYTRRAKLKISAIKATFLGNLKSLGIIDLHLTTTSEARYTDSTGFCDEEPRYLFRSYRR